MTKPNSFALSSKYQRLCAYRAHDCNSYGVDVVFVALFILLLLLLLLLRIMVTSSLSCSLSSSSVVSVSSLLLLSFLSSKNSAEKAKIPSLDKICRISKNTFRKSLMYLIFYYYSVNYLLFDDGSESNRIHHEIPKIFE